MYTKNLNQTQIDFKDSEIIQLNLDGWVPIQVEYIYMDVAFGNYLCWKIKGTTHMFRIDVPTVYKHHGQNVQEHFEMTLKMFRTDYITWTLNKDPRADRYHKEFGQLIMM